MTENLSTSFFAALFSSPSLYGRKTPKKLTKWAKKALGLPEVGVEVRLRGNQLHIFCEAKKCPSVDYLVTRFSDALASMDIQSLLPKKDRSRIEGIFVCGRAIGDRRPKWTVKLDTNGYCSTLRQGDRLFDDGTQELVDSGIQELVDGGIQELVSGAHPTVEESESLTPGGLMPGAHPTVEDCSKIETPLTAGAGSLKGGFSPSLKTTRKYDKPPSGVEILPVNRWSSQGPIAQTPRISQTVTKDLDIPRVTPLVKTAAGNMGNNLRETSTKAPRETTNLNYSKPSVDSKRTYSQQNFPDTMGHGQNQMISTLTISSATKKPNSRFSAPGISVKDPHDVNGLKADESREQDQDGKEKIPMNLLTPEEIASHLSEILAGLGISVSVRIEDNYSLGGFSTPDAPKNDASNFKKSKTKKSLLVLCEASYSPDPSLLAEPIAQRLRELQLKSFRSSLIQLQVRGEATPDWMLRVDLTPSDRILKGYARWGDVAAIERLVQRELSKLGVLLRATLKESTLHLFCSFSQEQEHRPIAHKKAPDKQKIKEAIAPILSTIAPKGIKAASIYGLIANVAPGARQPESGSAQKIDDDRFVKLKSGRESPVWIEWLNLPAYKHPDLAHSALDLGKNGHREALNYLLDRLLNPDIDRKLETGGIRAIVMPKGKILHVMSEAPTCPSQKKVVPPIVKFLRELNISGVTGVCVYGRRAGQKQPLWRYGVDFTDSSADFLEMHSQMETTPEFAASVTGDLVLGPAEVSILVSPHQPIPEEEEKPSGGLLLLIQKLLVGSGLFVRVREYSSGVETQSVYRDRPIKSLVALFSVAIGLGLTVQIDSFLGRFLQSSFTPPTVANQMPARQSANIQESNTEEPDAFREGINLQEESQIGYQIPNIPWQSSSENAGGIFNETEFIKSPTAPVEIQPEILELTRDYPSFNSQQLDEQLVRYQQFILAEKRPPDIFIIGSSRALRGVDPVVLEESLAARGYPGLKVYNFGVNGATVQVVDLILRRVLPPEQLPKLILFADGVRAVNGGRSDRTYEIIASSEGYQKTLEGTFKIETNFGDESPPTEIEEKSVDSLRNKYEKIEEYLQEMMEKYVATYPVRDRFKAFIVSLVKTNRQRMATEGGVFQCCRSAPGEVPQEIEAIANEFEEIENPKNRGKSKKTDEYQRNGFLPISIRFNPDVYYQNHPRVSGYYDADYSSFQLRGKQTVALKNLLEFTASLGVDVVFVNLPLTEEYLDEARSAYELEFSQYMQEIAQEYSGFVFRDLVYLWPQAEENFSDPSHLNRYGAIVVAEKLALDAMIPWPQN